MSERPLLNTEHVAPKVLEGMGTFHSDILAEVIKTVDSYDVVVVGMAQNPFVKKARKALSEASISFEYLEYGSYWSMWKQRLAIKMWSGMPTFPQVFVKGTLIGGFNETVAALEDGTLKESLEV